MNDLERYRTEIDEIDSELISLFVRRMNVSAEIAAYKKANGIPVTDASREEKKLEAAAAQAGEFGEYAKDLYKTLFALSKEYQRRLNNEK